MTIKWGRMTIKFVNFVKITLNRLTIMKRFAVLAVCLALFACAEKNPVLTVEGGQLQGVLTDSSDVMVYKGIPYAAPPVGELRWQVPQPVVPWEGVKVADEFGHIGIQTGNPPGTFYGDEFYWMGTPEQSEDCLYLNVWAPAKTVGKTDAGLPVAMWIHGGAYANGFGHEVTMDGDAWAQRGVILVTINYRLGILGFLSHPELSKEQGGVSGNYGMLDQIAALEWIHENIAQFGGDPDNITVLGQSAGAMSVKNLVASPKSKDMIAKAIIQSGGGLGGANLGGANGVPQEYYDAQGKAVMDANDCMTLEQMRAADGPSMLNFVNNYRAKTRGYASFSPHNDPDLLPEDFNAATFNGTIADIPYMIGSNSEDMGGLGGRAIDYFCEVRDSLSTQPAYKYYFSRNLPGDDEDPATDPGAFHSAELWYTFQTLKNSWRPFTKADYALSDEMVDAWTNFCKTGNPGWPEYTKSNPYTKEFNIK